MTEPTAVNEFGQPVGFPLQEDWSPPSFPPHKTLPGQYCQLEPLQASRHGEDLWKSLCEDPNGARWTYLPYGPFTSLDDFQQWVVKGEQGSDTQFYAIVVDGQAVGFTAYLRIDPSQAAIEVGHLYFSLRLAKTRAATEAIYLMASNAFELGYRRVEWKCDSCNLPSRNAATRYGFTYEGLFRQASAYKGRNRDTAWFSIIDRDWNSELKKAFQRWLEPNNFDENGQQKQKLSELTATVVRA